MRLFRCQTCRQVLYFENTACEKCGHRLGYLPEMNEISAVEADGANWIAFADPASRYRFCANWERDACNWLVNAEDETPYCRACRHNRTVPDLSSAENHDHWRKIETAKRRLFYTLIKLRLPLPTATNDDDDEDTEPLVFDFLADPPDGPGVMTGHNNGVITLALNEADDTVREAARSSLGELYRTLLGHFRHEIGHFYWNKLVRDSGEETHFRALYGDERADYGAALDHHYREGAPKGWRKSFVSAYATMHPWEDWAETWAHYLHIVDTLETAQAFGLRVSPAIAEDPAFTAEISFDPHHAETVDALIAAWLPLTYAVNSLNRSMGLQDLYPFVIQSTVVEKLSYIHALVQRGFQRG